MQRTAVNSSPINAVPPIVHDVLNSPGQPLDAATRSFMEPRFGHDFSSVRVHTDAKAAESAWAVSALAYTVGHNVVFGDGQYKPQTNEGRVLMAHELTHVVQQDGTMPSRQLALGESGSHAEREADSVSQAVVAGQSVSASQIHSVLTIQRQGALLAWQQDLQQRASRVRSLRRTGTASMSLFQDSASGKLSGYQIHQNFTLELAQNARASDYAIVQWIKGDLYEQRGATQVYWPASTGLYGKSSQQPWHFTDWVIDSPDADPRFGSDRGLTVQVSTTSFDDNPAIVMQQGRGPLPANLRWHADARVGVYPWGSRVPATIRDWESQRPTPFQEVPWGWDITVPATQDSLTVNFQ